MHGQADLRLQLLAMVEVVVGSELSPVTSVQPGDAGSPVSPPLQAGLGWLGFTFPKYAIGMQPAYGSQMIWDYQSVVCSLCHTPTSHSTHITSHGSNPTMFNICSFLKWRIFKSYFWQETKERYSHLSSRDKSHLTWVLTWVSLAVVV